MKRVILPQISEAPIYMVAGIRLPPYPSRGVALVAIKAPLQRRTEAMCGASGLLSNDRLAQRRQAHLATLMATQALYGGAGGG